MLPRIIFAGVIVGIIGVAIDYAFHKTYFEPAFNYPLNADYKQGFPIEGLDYYGSKFIVITIVASGLLHLGRQMHLSKVQQTAGIASLSSAAFSLFYAVVRSFVPLDLAMQIYLVHAFAIGVGAAVVLKLGIVKRN